ncbi:MAG: hypothetical protein R3300_03475 [Candidatus Promineifilaceae bacterium]|nr:hypothetical protein [Candidatus Promineifilaceae bacterium]
MDQSAYYRIGRWAAWLAAISLVVGVILFGPWLSALESAQQGLAPAEAAAVRFNHTHDGVARVFAFQLLFLVALWAFVPIGRALRAHFGHNSLTVFMDRAFLAAALLGSATQFLDLAITSAAYRLVPQLSAAELPAIALTYTPLREGAAWAISAAFFLMAIGYALAGRLALRTGELPRPWAYLTLALAVVAALSLPAQTFGLPTVGQLSLLGVIVGSAVWSVWLGLLLQASERARTPSSTAAAVGS